MAAKRTAGTAVEEKALGTVLGQDEVEYNSMTERPSDPLHLSHGNMVHQ